MSPTRYLKRNARKAALSLDAVAIAVAVLIYVALFLQHASWRGPVCRSVPDF